MPAGDVNSYDDGWSGAAVGIQAKPDNPEPGAQERAPVHDHGIYRPICGCHGSGHWERSPRLLSLCAVAFRPFHSRIRIPIGNHFTFPPLVTDRNRLKDDLDLLGMCVYRRWN